MQAKDYHCTFISYERFGNMVQPVRVRKEWVDGEYKVVRTDKLAWADRALPSMFADWSSIAKLEPFTRTQLMASGHIKEAGHGQPCFMLNP